MKTELGRFSSYFGSLNTWVHALIKRFSKMFESLYFLDTVFLSPMFSIFIWYFFLQFSKVVDFKVYLNAFVLNMLSYVKVLSRDEDFLLLIGFDQTP
jgi:hypothetical protein